MLSLTRKTDYALIALSHLGAQSPQRCSARSMADTFGVSLPLLMNVLKQLSAAELVSSVRGAQGGYTLARPLGEITLGEVISTLEGPVRLTRCQSGSDAEAETCQARLACPIQGPLRRLHDRLEAFFDDVTLADLATAEAAAPGGMERS